MTSYTYSFTVNIPGPDDEEAGDVATTLADALTEPARCYGWEVSPFELVSAVCDEIPGMVIGIRQHPHSHMHGVGELRGVTAPAAVVLRDNGSVDAYGDVDVIDQRPEHRGTGNRVLS